MENTSSDIQEDVIPTVEVPIHDQILQKVIEMQSLLNKHQASIEFQDSMLRIFFGDMGGPQVGAHEAKSNSPSLSKLLVQLLETWDGSLGDIYVPACWEQLKTMFVALGMVESMRYRVCQGLEVNTHEPILYQPSLEDSYYGNTIECTCGGENRRGRKKLKRDCLVCCEKCSQCALPRKELLSFD